MEKVDLRLKRSTPNLNIHGSDFRVLWPNMLLLLLLLLL